jgi:hypothetical protein
MDAGGIVPFGECSGKVRRAFEPPLRCEAAGCELAKFGPPG